MRIERWDAFISHASEDKHYARSLAQQLSLLGWEIWIDSGELVVGRSLRNQLDDGLRQSRFGVVVLSKSFFKKQWPARELDALLGREDSGQTRLLPIWLGVSKSDVEAWSPILASRVSHVSGGNEADDSRTLTASMERIIDEEGPWAARVRHETTMGLPWTDGPYFLSRSLQRLSGEEDTYWRTNPSVAPQLRPPPLPMTFRGVFENCAGDAFDGLYCLFPGWSQRYQTLRSGAHRHVTGRIVGPSAEWVLQIGTIDSQLRSSALIYVRGVGGLPRAPADHITWTAGLPIARGRIPGDPNRGMAPQLDVIYMMAPHIFHVPEDETEARKHFERHMRPGTGQEN